MSAQRRIAGSRGFILITGLLAMGAIFFFSLIYIRLYTADKSLSLKAELSLVADEAALAGIEDSLDQVRQNQAWNTGFNAVSLPRSGATYTVTFNKAQNAVPWSTNNSSGSEAVAGWGGRTVPPNALHLVSTGAARNEKVTRQVILQVSSSLFHDDFESVSGNWNQVMGENFEIKNGSYDIGRMGQSGGEHRTFAGNTDWTDYVVETKATLKSPQNSTSNGYGIYFRATNVKSVNAYIFQYDPGYDNSRGGSFIFRKVINGAEQSPFARVLRNSTPEFAEKEGKMDWWYNKERKVRLEITGNRFVAYVDEIKVLDATDMSNQFPNGETGLRTWSSAYAQFEELTVTGGGAGGSSTLRIMSRF
ncbi:MAG: hypothetical protein AB2L14_17515 [Candidatus Xenobiia bacterium LiM19]